MSKILLEELLDNLEWKKNIRRPNVSGTNYVCFSKNTPRYTKIGNPCFSYTFGFNKKLHLTKISEKYPKIYEMAKNYIQEIYPDFKYTTITINKNICCLPHRDNYNKNDSLIISFGDFTEGGNLYVKKDNQVECLYNKDTPVIFSGNNLHWNDQPNGKRYSLVYYNLE